jgi:hypothetical protein
LCIKERAKHHKRWQRHGWMCDNIHPAASFFIHHPIGNHELIAARKCYLYLMRPKRNGPAHHSYSLAVERVIRIVNRQRNMGSV